jgi:hypothetical protein
MPDFFAYTLKKNSELWNIFDFNKIIMNAKKTRFYAAGAIVFAEMCSTTYSCLCERDSIEKKGIV